MITSIQVLYYLGEKDLQLRLQSLKKMLKPNGIFYATMMGVQNGYFDLAEYHADGMYKVQLNVDRLSKDPSYIQFTKSRKHLLKIFQIFEPLYVGWYDAVYDEQEGGSFHWTFMGR